MNFCYIFVTFWKLRDLIWTPVPDSLGHCTAGREIPIGHCVNVKSESYSMLECAPDLVKMTLSKWSKSAPLSWPRSALGQRTANVVLRRLADQVNNVNVPEVCRRRGHRRRYRRMDINTFFVRVVGKRWRAVTRDRHVTSEVSPKRKCVSNDRRFRTLERSKL